MTIQEYIATNKQWLGARVSANLDQVPEDKWPALLAGVKVLGGSEPGIDCDVVITHETFADFDQSRAQRWSESGTRKEAMLADCKSLLFDHFQSRRGTPRTSILVIDIGDKRVVLQ